MDISVSGIEVTQVTQCFGDPADLRHCEDGDNSIPLVAGKATVARVYVSLTQVGPGVPRIERLRDVQVALLAWDSGTGEMLAGSPMRGTVDLVEAGATLTQMRNSGRRTANILLPEAWTNASYRHGIDLNAIIEEPPDECGSCAANNDFILRQATFHTQGELVIYPVRIRYTYGSNDSIPDDHQIGRSLYNRVKQFFPVNEEDVIVHTDAERVLRVNYNLGTAEGMSDLLDDLADRFVCYEDDFWACGWVEGHYFGVFARDVVFGRPTEERPNGWGGIGRRNDCVAAGREGGQGTAAHEISHNLGRRHASNEHGEDEGGAWEDWPYPHGGIGVTGFDTWSDDYSRAVRRVSNPAQGWHRHDLMAYGSRRWMSPHTYLALYENLGFCTDASPAVPTLTAAPQPAAFWLIAGRLRPTLAIRPIYQITADASTASNNTSGRYRLELQDASGAVLASRSFDPVEGHAGHDDVGAFRQYLPDVSGAARVVLKDGPAVLFSRELSAHAPTVSVTQPAAGASWPAQGYGTIRWTASDTDGDALTYVVMYSRDGGRTWVNLATGLQQLHYDIELETLGGAAGQAQIRVLANDGMRTGKGESGLFNVAAKPPMVYIQNLEPNQLIVPGQGVLLLGSAADREDGLLPSAALIWIDSVAGVLGSGSEILTLPLKPGPHTITLQASDKDGNITSSAVAIYVGYQVWLPLAFK
jgi:hypothetical protein